MSNSNSTKYAFVDDQSPRIEYSGTWFNENVDGAWNQTLSFANTSGSSAAFNFTGNRVGVLGFVYFEDASKAPISEYMVDDGSPSIFQPTIDQNGTEVTYFLSPLLADGEHTLVFQLASDSTPFFVDAIVYNASATKPSATGGASQPTIVTTIVQAPSGSSTATGAVSSGSSDLVGPIVGGVVGGITLIVCACLAFYYLYWKPTRQRAHYDYHATMTHDDWDSDTKPLFLASGADATARQSSLSYTDAATPYPPPAPSTRSVSVYSTDTQTLQFASPEPSPAPSRQNSRAQSQSYQDTPSSSSSSAPSVSASSSSSRQTVLVLAGTQPLRIAPRNRKAVEAGVEDESAPARPVQQHQDSGYRFDAAGPSGTSHEDDARGGAAAAVVPEELPPVYSES